MTGSWCAVDQILYVSSQAIVCVSYSLGGEYNFGVMLKLVFIFPPVHAQYVFKSEAHGFRTVHEELAKGMTFDLKSNEHSAVRNVLKVRPLR